MMNYKFPQMSNETTLKLIEKYQHDEDIEARNDVLLGNIRLIYSIAHRYRRSLDNAFEDFVSEGILGMIEAINRFDVSNYQNFSTYAYWHILKRVNSSVNMGTLKLPQHRIHIYQEYEREKSEMLGRGETPSFEIIAQRIGVSDALLTDTINKKDDISLTEPNGTVDDVPTGNFEDDIITKIDFERVSVMINALLSNQERDILKYRFGLDDSEPLTLQETAQHLNISTEYVRILQNKSLSKLKRSLSKTW